MRGSRPKDANVTGELALLSVASVAGSDDSEFGFTCGYDVVEKEREKIAGSSDGRLTGQNGH